MMNVNDFRAVSQDNSLKIHITFTCDTHSFLILKHCFNNFPNTDNTHILRNLAYKCCEELPIDRQEELIESRFHELSLSKQANLIRKFEKIYLKNA